MKKYMLLFVILSVSFLILSCDEEPDKCEEAPAFCNTTAPTDGDIDFDLTTNNVKIPVTIILKTGSDYDTGKKYAEYTQSSSSFSVTVPNGEYSAMATYEYTYKGKTYIIESIDGDDLSADSETYCDDKTCYESGTLNLDLTFDEEAFKETIDNDTNSQVCFIATAAYGSPYTKEVVFLRNFRDTVLRHYAAGRFFIKQYYAYSPYAASKIRDSEPLKAVIRFFISLLIMCIKHPFAAAIFPLLIVPAILFLRKNVRLGFIREKYETVTQYIKK
jgi:hypothetical protein